MPRGNGFDEKGIQPSLNAFFFSKEVQPRDVALGAGECSLQESIKTIIYMKEQLKVTLKLHVEVSTKKIVKIKAHKRIINGKTVKVRSHYRVIEG